MGRSVHTLAVKATNRFEDQRYSKELSKRKTQREIIFTKGATSQLIL